MTLKLAGTTGITFADNTVQQTTAPLSPAYLTNLLYPSIDGRGRDIARAGWLANINQQWGGAYHFTELMDAPTGTVYKFEPATGNVQDDNHSSVSVAAGNYYQAQGFKVSETGTYNAAWLKLFKNGNPTYTLTARIWSDNGSGAPSAALGTATTISTQVITSKTEGEWYRFTGFNVTLTAGTQYHLVFSTLAAVDSTNYIRCRETTAKKYPFGSLNTGTSAPAWTPYTSECFCFLIEPPVGFIQSGGRFDQKLVFGGQATMPGQQKVLTQPLRNFFDGKYFTYLTRWTAAGLSATLFDFAYGLDHDRIVGGTNASGYPYVTLYRQDGTSYTVTGTSSVATGDQDIAVVARMYGDGADTLTLYVNGTSVGTPLTGQTFTMDPLFRELGNASLGGGFPAAPSWTQSMTFASLPSAQGWTWSGVGTTEANTFSIQNGKLYQNAMNGSTTGYGYYSKTTSLSNSTGSTIEWKGRVVSSPNIVWSNSSFGCITLNIADGTKTLNILIAEYFLQVGCTGGSTADFTVQGDFKTSEHVITVCLKGSDFYIFIDGKLAIDGTGKLTATSAANTINFGDVSAVANDNGDCIVSYVKYYQGGMLLPTPSTASLSEAAFWSGNQSALLGTLYNSGAPISVKQMCGVTKNYVGEPIVQREKRYGITTSPTTASATLSVIAEMECYIFGRESVGSGLLSSSNSAAANQTVLATFIDGAQNDAQQISSPGANYNTQIAALLTPDYLRSPKYLGLHKVDLRWACPQTTTISRSGAYSNLIVESRS